MSKSFSEEDMQKTILSLYAQHNNRVIYPCKTLAQLVAAVLGDKGNAVQVMSHIVKNYDETGYLKRYRNRGTAVILRPLKELRPEGVQVL